MPYIVKDVMNGIYYTKEGMYSDRAADRRYAHIFESEKEAIEVAVQLKKKSNAQYATYLRLFGNEKWDPTWPVPKESHWRQLDSDEEAAGDNPSPQT